MRGILATLLLAASVLARDLRVTLNISNAEVSPDGFRRRAIVVNGVTPGRPIIAMKGDRVFVTVNNQLTDLNMRRSTTVHWHGLLQHKSAFEDGVAFVTQCPIAPNHQYTYAIDTKNQAGTFWYHGHMTTQYADGLRGPFIIHDPLDPHMGLYDVDDQTTIIQLYDWFHSYAEDLATDWKTGLIPEPAPDSNCLNGVGRYQRGPQMPRAVINVIQGKRYRFRLINMSAATPFRFAIDAHDLTIIEADGVNHQPVTAASLPIAAGQRYSVVVNANQAVANYWVAHPGDYFGQQTTLSNTNYNGTEAFAILRYQGAPDADPTTPQPTVKNDNTMLTEDKLKPLENPAPPGGATPDMVVKVNFTTTRPGTGIIPGVGNRWLVNGVEYKPPKVPTLVQHLNGGKPEDGVITLPPNKNIEVQFIGDKDHPFHLHGHTFSVIQAATGVKNIVNPPRRDTVVTSGDLQNPVTVRFRTDNPGPWFLHCHKDWHLEAGLAVVFAEAVAEERQGAFAIKPTQAWKELCNIYNALPADMQ